MSVRLQVRTAYSSSLRLDYFKIYPCCNKDKYFIGSGIPSKIAFITILAKPVPYRDTGADIQPPFSIWIPDQVRNGIVGCAAQAARYFHTSRRWLQTRMDDYLLKYSEWILPLKKTIVNISTPRLLPYM
jgi:hypothetical protein